MSSRLEYVTRESSVYDLDKIVELLKMVFRGWPGYDIPCSEIEHGRWKFFDASNGPNPIVVSEFDGIIIGVDIGILKNTKIGDNIYCVDKGCETATHPGYRRRGVNKNNTKYTFEILEKNNIPLFYSVTSNPVLIKSHTSPSNIRESFPFPLRYLVKIDNVSLHLKNEDNLSRKQLITSRIGIPFPKQYNKIKKVIKHGLGNNFPDIRIKRINRFDDRIDDFWDIIKDDYDFIVEKKKDYLNWRYCDPRGGEYKVWIAKENSNVLGFLVLKINSINKEYRRGYLVDVLCVNERMDIVDMLIDFSVKYFEEKDVNVVHAQIIKGHLYEKILNKHGFLDSRKNPLLDMKIISMNKDVEKFLNTKPKRIHFTYGESDSI